MSFEPNMTTFGSCNLWNMFLRNPHFIDQNLFFTTVLVYVTVENFWSEFEVKYVGRIIQIILFSFKNWVFRKESLENFWANIATNVAFSIADFSKLNKSDFFFYAELKLSVGVCSRNKIIVTESFAFKIRLSVLQTISARLI